MQGIFYSVCGDPDYRETPPHLAQLRCSIKSLKRVNAHIPVYVFSFGTPAFLLENILGCADVHIVEKPDYALALERHCGGRATVFAQYPILHRWLALEEFRDSAFDGLLYLDTDTYFLSDPAPLFRQYREFDFYTREEPCTPFSYLGYDPQYLHDGAMQLLAHQLSIQLAPTMNIGIVLMNNRIWERIPFVLDIFFSYLWRFLIWMVQHPHPRIAAERRLRALLDKAALLAGPADWETMLPFPSSNGWILDEISMLFTLGHLERFTSGYLDRRQILQGPEFIELDPAMPEFRDAVVCHYYSKNYYDFLRWRESKLGQKLD